MFQGKSRPAREWGDLVRKASPHTGRGRAFPCGTDGGRDGQGVERR